MRKPILAACLVVLGSSVSRATLLFSDPGTGTTTTFPATGANGGGAGPYVVNGFTVTGQHVVSYGDFFFGLGAKGSWSGFPLVTTTTDSAGTFTIALGGLFGLVGGF